MKCLYLSFRQNRLLRLLALAILSIVASSAAAETIDLGELSLDTEYKITADFNSYIGHYTAAKTGVLKYVNRFVFFTPYSDASLGEENELSSNYAGYDSNGGQVRSINVEQGTTYWFYLDQAADAGVFYLSMDDKLTLSRSTVDEGAKLSVGGRGAIEYTFSQSVAVDKATISVGSVSKELTSADETLRLSGATVIVEYGAILTAWYEQGVVKAGDQITVAFEGLCSAGDASIKYDGTGNAQFKYVAANKPVTLVSAKTADGTYELTNTQYASFDFLSYFKTTDPTGKYVFTFSDPIDPDKGSFELNFGSQEANDWYAEPVFAVFSNDNKTITIDVTDKLRDYKTMSSLGYNYGEIYLAMRNIYSAEGELVYTGVSGSEGSFNFPFKYKVVSNTSSVEFTPNDKLGDSVEIYVSDYDQISYNGVKFYWTENREVKSIIVPQNELTVTTDDFGGAAIVVAVPADVKSLNNVSVVLNDLTFNDGQDHTAAFVNVFNYVAPTVAENLNYTYTPNYEASVTSCDKLVLTFPDYQKVVYSKGTALMSGRSNTAYVVLDAAKQGEVGNQMIQPIKDATSNDHYTVTFPEGYFELADNVVSPEFSATFAVYAEQASKESSVATSPANGDVVESCDKIVVTFNDYNAAACSWLSKATISKDGGEAQNLPDPEYGDEDNQMVQPLGGLAAEDGVYTVTFPAEYFVLGEEGEDFSEEIVVTFTVGQEKEAEFHFVSDPVSGSTVESCDKIRVEFSDYALVGLGQGKATIQRRGDMEFGVQNLGDAAYDWDADNAIFQSLDGLAADEGMYIVTFPAGYFDLMVSDEADPEASPEFYVTFIVEKAKSSTVNITSVPADGATVDACDEIDIIFNDYDEAGVSYNGKATISKDGGEPVELGEAEFGTAWNEVVQPLGDAAKEEGSYVVSFPEGYFTSDEAHNYDNIPAFTISFKVGEGAGITDITINGADAQYFNLNGVQVANPAKGLFIVKRGNTVTKETLK
jgi:hypothetical protein